MVVTSDSEVLLYVQCNIIGI